MGPDWASPSVWSTIALVCAVLVGFSIVIGIWRRLAETARLRSALRIRVGSRYISYDPNETDEEFASRIDRTIRESSRDGKAAR